MSRFANIPDEVRAVFPMRGNYIKGTAASHVGNKDNWDVVSKLGAIADGHRTTTTSNAMQDIMAMRRLQPGDNIAFYNKDSGDVVFSNYQNADRLPQEIFYPANQGGYNARQQYALNEGGNSNYSNVTLFGGFKPEVIPLDQPFSEGAGYKPALSGNSYLMQFDNPSEAVNYASYLPANSNEPGTVNRLPKQIADKIRAREAYTPTYADTGLYKDSQLQWEQSPIPGQASKGRSPYLATDINNPIYDYDQLGALGLTNIDGNLVKVQWENTGAKNGVQAFYGYDADGNRAYIDLNNPEHQHLAPFKPVFVPHNLINQAFSKPAQYGTTDTRSNYRITGQGYNNAKGQEVFRLDRRSVPLDTNQYSSSMFQTPDDALNSVNALINQGNPRDGSVKEIYYGSTSEPSYNAIQRLARSGGSGRWVDDVSPYDDYNLWKMGGSSYADSMNRIDLENAGYALDDYAGGVAFDQRGIPTDITSYKAPLGYRNLAPASEFLSNAPQHTYIEPRQIQRLMEESELPPLTPLQRYSVNEYGIIQNKELGRMPLSVQAYNGALDNSQLASTGRWSGGGLEGKGSNRTDGTNDPLIGTYKIRLPQDVAYKAVNVNGRYQQEIPTGAEDKFIPYETRYDIDYGVIPGATDENNYRFGNTIPGRHVNKIEGAYLPGLVETGSNQFEPQMVPYSPHPDYYDQHLADVRIKLGNEYYPLTREATTTQYLPSQKQLEQQAGEMYGRRKFFKDGSFEEYDNYGSVPSYEEGIKARNAAVYNNPDIEGATDIIGALDRERNLIKRLSTVAEQKLPYNVTPGVGYNAIDPYGSMKTDMMLLQSNPLYAANARVNITPKYTEQSSNTLRDSVLYGRSEGVNYPHLELNGLPVSKVYPDGTPKYDTPRDSEPRILPNREGATIGKSTSLNRFISDDEVLDIERKMGIRPTRKQLVETDDGNNYYIDADDEMVKASDLATLFDNPNKKLSLDEVMHLLDTKINNFTQAENAYTQLMNLEPQDEININAQVGKKQGARLGNQLQQQGLETNYSNGNLTATGSMNVNSLPGYEDFTLPVTRFKQDNSDLELTNLAKLGRATKEYNRVLNQRNNLYDMGVRLPSRLDPVFSPNDDPAEIRLHQIMQDVNANPPNMIVDEIPNPWNTPEETSITNFDTVPNTKMSDAYLHKYLAPPNYSMVNTGDIAGRLPRTRVKMTGTVRRLGDSFPELAQSQPIAQSIPQAIEKVPSVINSYTGDIAGRANIFPRPGLHFTRSPQPIGQQEPIVENMGTMEQQNQQQYPQWLKPGLIGAGVLGVAGLSQYYQQQQQDRDNEEMQLRRIYGY